MSNLSSVEQRLAECVSRGGGQRFRRRNRHCQNELQAFGRRLRRSAHARSGHDRIGRRSDRRIERAAVSLCGPATPIDQALLLIARQHGAAPR